MLPTCWDNISDMSATDKNVCQKGSSPQTHLWTLPAKPVMPYVIVRCAVAIIVDVFVHRAVTIIAAVASRCRNGFVTHWGLGMVVGSSIF